jgi:hypothetical protein
MLSPFYLLQLPLPLLLSRRPLYLLFPFGSLIDPHVSSLLLPLLRQRVLTIVQRTYLGYPPMNDQPSLLHLLPLM